MRRSASALSFSIGAALFACPRASCAETDASSDEPPVAIAVVSGALTALVPLALGGARMAAAPLSSDGARNVGYVVAGVGPALSPIVSHVVLGEWARAAAFGAPTVASEIGLASLVAANPQAIFQGTTLSRVAFSLLVSADLFGAAFSMVDVAMAKDRWEAKRRKRATSPLSGLTFAPRVGARQLGFVIGGAL